MKPLIPYTLLFFFFDSLSGTTSSATPAPIDNETDILITLTRVSWVVLPIIITISANRYFKKRDEQVEEQKKLFNTVAEKIGHLENTLAEQTAKFAGMMEKMQSTANTMAEVMRDVKEHDKIIARISALLEVNGKKV